MSTQIEPDALADAWWLMPPAAPVPSSVSAFTSTRMNRAINLIAGLACLVLGAQAFLAALGGEGLLAGWNDAFIIVCFVPLLLMCVCTSINRFVVPMTATFALLYPVVLIVWPLVLDGQPVRVSPEPWIWFLINVATAAAVLAFELPIQLIWTIGIPLLYGLVRLITGGFAPEFWIAVAFEVPFALILGGVVLTLALVFRRVASNVDAARSSAVATYASAAEAQATAEERVEIAGLMHDSVLAALIAAERATSPREQALAASMAREALAGLASAESGDDADELDPLTPSELAIALRGIVSESAARVPITYAEPVRGKSVPGRVARQLLQAAGQAIANGVQHADSAGLTAHIEPIPGDGVRIQVSDTGPGFDPASIPADRLGIRASIVARVTAVGGTATIDSGPNGTTVTIRWDGDAAW